VESSTGRRQHTLVNQPRTFCGEHPNNPVASHDFNGDIVKKTHPCNKGEARRPANATACSQKCHGNSQPRHSQPNHWVSGPGFGTPRTLHATSTYEIDANRRDVGFRVRIVREPEQQTGLTNARVSNQQQFEQVIAANAKSDGKSSHCANGTSRMRDNPF
jgi:ribosomal protein L40E